MPPPTLPAPLLALLSPSKSPRRGFTEAECGAGDTAWHPCQPGPESSPHHLGRAPQAPRPASSPSAPPGALALPADTG